MAVYTELTGSTIEAFLREYDIGALRDFKGIAEGVENTNFLLQTTQGRFILTLFERRVKEGDLPWFLGLMRHLHARGLACPQPIGDREGRAAKTLAGRPAAITSFLPGRPVEPPDERSCRALGGALARFHLLGLDYAAERENGLSVTAWRPLLESCAGKGDSLLPGLTREISAALDRIEREWPKKGALPRGQIHADLFPDNLFFEDGKASDLKVSGVIDFYFACTDFLAYDIAICLNAWCFRDETSFEPEYAAALLSGYEAERGLDEAERAALPLLCQGAAARFLLTRLYDRLNTPSGALVTPKDPLAYLRRLRHFARAGALA